MEIRNDGLLGAWTIDADGTPDPLDWHQIDDPVPPDCWRWVHLHRDAAKAQAWLLDGVTPPAAISRAMLAEDTRPRYTEIEGKGLLILRGVNLNDGAEPEDMVSIRVFVDTQWIVTVSLRRLAAVDSIIADIEAGQAPPKTSAFVEQLVRALHQRVEPVLDELQEVIETHELEALNDSESPDRATRAAFTDARQDAIIIRRHIAPQSATLRALAKNPPFWLESGTVIGEEAETFARIVDDLDDIRERAAVLRDEMTARMTERQNTIILVLSVVSVVFLPIAFVTGLLGMNVAGIPLTETQSGFWIVCAILGIMASVSGFLVWTLLKR